MPPPGGEGEGRGPAVADGAGAGVEVPAAPSEARGGFKDDFGTYFGGQNGLTLCLGGPLQRPSGDKHAEVVLGVVLRRFGDLFWRPKWLQNGV